MRDNEDAEARAEAEEDQPILGLRMVGIVDQDGVIVIERGGSVFERDAMSTQVRGSLARIPLETERSGHAYIIPTL